MIPGPWEFALLALAAFRVTRLLGWDDLPPIAAAREALLGPYWVSDGTREPEGPYYDRPLLAALFECAFCLGFWVSLATYLAWWALPGPTLAAATVAAISAAVGLAAKNLDA